MNGPHIHPCKAGLLLSLFLSSVSLRQEVPNAALPRAISQPSTDDRKLNLCLHEGFKEGIIIQK